MSKLRLYLHESESKATGGWERLVQFLVESKQYGRAQIAAQQGIQAIGNQWPTTITNSLSCVQQLRILQPGWAISMVFFC